MLFIGFVHGFADFHGIKIIVPLYYFAFFFSFPMTSLASSL